MTLLFSSCSNAKQDVLILYPQQAQPLLKYSQYIEDAGDQYTWSQALVSEKWQETGGQDLNLGITDSSFWFKVRLRYAQAHNRIFQIHYPLLDYVDFYLIQDQVLVKQVNTGDALPFSSRDLSDKDFSFSYFHPGGSDLTLLIRAKTQGTMVLPLTSVSAEAYAGQESLEHTLMGIYLGITLAMFLYNLMLFFYLKDPSYLYYCLFVFVIFLSIISYTGHGFYWLWPNSPEMNAYMAPLTASFGFLAATLFMTSFLQANKRGLVGRRVVKVSLFLSVFVIVATLFLTYSASLKFISLIQFVLTLVFLSFSIHLWRRGILEAKYFTLAWLSFIAGNLISALRVLGILPSNDFTVNANLFGNVIEMLMLSMGLAYRFETMRKVQNGLSRELRLAQQQAIHNLEKFRDLFQQSPVGLFRFDRASDAFFCNQKILRLMPQGKDIRAFLRQHLAFSDYKRLLKHSELKDQLIRLNNNQFYNLSLLIVKDEQQRVVEIEGTLYDISEQKQAEKIRIASEKEKLNNLSQLVVGISHQFNTPLGVVITTEDLIKKSLQQVLMDIDKGLLKKEDLQQTLLLIQDAISLSGENTKVMSSILNDLKYSISTRTELNLIDIDSQNFFTDLLGYFKAQLKEEGLPCSFKLEVDKQGIEFFRCDYDVISDVLLRLYTNSYYHAFEEQAIADGVGVEQRISIKLEEDEGYIVILYRDNGRGLTAAERENIFIPFFTGNSRQKDNSGLGMYILHNQVVKILSGKVELLNPESGFAIKLKLPKY